MCGMITMAPTMVPPTYDAPWNTQDSHQEMFDNWPGFDAGVNAAAMWAFDAAAAQGGVVGVAVAGNEGGVHSADQIINGVYDAPIPPIHHHHHHHHHQNFGYVGQEVLHTDYNYIDYAYSTPQSTLSIPANAPTSYSYQSELEYSLMPSPTMQQQQELLDQAQARRSFSNESESSSSNTATSSVVCSPPSSREASYLTPPQSPSPVVTPRSASAIHRRRKFDKEERRKTHQTRLVGACIECWRIKKRCIAVPSPGCCETCNQIINKLPNEPCYRSRLTSSELFRKGPTEDFLTTPRGFRWLKTAFNDPKVWRSSTPARHITISQSTSQNHNLTISLTVKLFNPQPGDSSTYHWTTPSGTHGSLSLPPFAIADIDAAEDSINTYTSPLNLPLHISTYVGNDPISAPIFQTALNLSLSGTSPLLKSSLRLWAASRIIESPWSLSSSTPDSLDLTPLSDPNSPYHSRIPVTPVIDFQLDAITIHRVLLPLRKRVLADLQKKIQDNKPDSFLEIFLCTYILLHNIELQLKHDAWFARRHGVQGKWSNVELVEKVALGGNVLLTHWQRATKGGRVFDEVPKGGSKSKNGGGEELWGVLRVRREEVREKVRGQRRRGGFEEGGFWTGQCFEAGGMWRPVGGITA